MAGKKDTSGKKAARTAKFGQIIQAFRMQVREDKALIPWLAGAFLLPVVVGVLVGFFVLGNPWYLLVLGILVGVLLVMITFARRVQSNVYSKAEGQPGAAGWALDNMRGKWIVSQAVAGTTQLDAVHRVLGRPGVVLVAEGAPHRVKSLLAQEKKRVARVVGKTPIYDIVVGDEEGEVPLRKLQNHVQKLPRNLQQTQVEELEKRLGALSSRGAAMPKGPMPQGAKMRNVQRTARRR